MQEEQEFSRLNAFKFAPTYLHLHMGTNVGMGQVTGVNLSYVELSSCASSLHSGVYR